MRFYDQFSQLIVKDNIPFYSDVKHIHSTPNSGKKGLIYQTLKGMARPIKIPVVQNSDSNVWMVEHLATRRPVAC